MSRSEASLWRRIRDLVAGSDAHFIRVENPVLPGTPDVNYCIDGVEGWIELKAAPDWPKRPGSIVRVPHFRRVQRIWLRDRSRAGGLAWMLFRVDGPGDWLLFRGQIAAEHLGQYNKLDTEALAFRRWEGTPELDDFLEALRTHPAREP